MPRSSEQEWRYQITRSGLPATVRHVAHTYALHMNPDGGGAKVGIRRLMDETGLAFETIRDAIRTLEDEKWLVCILPASGRRPASYAAYIPGDIWDEIAVDRPEEIMRRDKLSTPASDSPTESQQGFVTHPLSHNGERDASDPESYPQDQVCDSPTESQNEFARGLRAASDSLTESHLYLLRQEPPQPPHDPATADRGGGGSSAPNYRDPNLWRQAGEITDRAAPTNPTAYRHAVYDRLHQERAALELAAQHQAAIDNCTHCTSNGLLETDTGWIRCTHPQENP